MVEPQLSQKAVEGFAQAALYDQHRPSYPDEAVTALLEAAKLIGLDAASLVDLAAGTGKFTEALAARPERFRTLAVEPHAQMREQLARKNLDDVTVAEGYSTAIPAASETIDAVFVAQAFHWFANRESLHEIHRVLKPLGVLGLIWNAEDYNTPATHPPTTPWSTRLRTHIFSLPSQTADHEPRFRNNAWRDVFTSQVSTTPLTAALVGNDNSLFTLPLGEKSVQWDVWLSEDRLWERVCTLGHFRGLDSGALETSHTIFKDIMSAPDAGVERDEQGRIKVHGFTIVVWTEKIPEVAAVA